MLVDAVINCLRWELLLLGKYNILYSDLDNFPHHKYKLGTTFQILDTNKATTTSPINQVKVKVKAIVLGSYYWCYMPKWPV